MTDKGTRSGTRYSGKRGNDRTIHRGVVSAHLPGVNNFYRDKPAELEGPAEAWALARTAIDYGSAVFELGGDTRAENGIRDAVMSALLRRTLITSEAVVELLSRGLAEPAMSVMRTLLDIEVAMRLIHADRSDRFAKRLAACHYLLYQKHGEGMLSNRPTREGLLTSSNRVAELVEVSRNYARLLESDVFDEVRAEVESDRLWHGFKNAEEAFKAIGQEQDYHMTYDSATWFVHAANPDHDFVDRSEGRLVARSFVERDPKAILPMLGHAVMRTIELIAIFQEDRGVSVDAKTGAKAQVRVGDEDPFDVDSITALRTLAISHFDLRHMVAQ